MSTREMADEISCVFMIAILFLTAPIWVIPHVVYKEFAK